MILTIQTSRFDYHTFRYAFFILLIGTCLQGFAANSQILNAELSSNSSIERISREISELRRVAQGSRSELSTFSSTTREYLEDPQKIDLLINFPDHIRTHEQKQRYFLNSVALGLELAQKIAESVEQAGSISMEGLYNAGYKTTISMSGGFELNTGLINLSVASLQLILDLDDLLLITQEGQDNWISYWIQYKLGFSAELYSLPHIGATVSHRGPQIDDPTRSFEFASLTGQFAGVNLTYGRVNHSQTSTTFETSGFEPTTALGDITALKVSGSAVRGELRREVLMGYLGSALMQETGSVDWKSVLGGAIDSAFGVAGNYAFFTLTTGDDAHRPLTASDNPIQPEEGLPYANSFYSMRGGEDVDSDGWGDNVLFYDGSPSVSAPYTVRVNFFSDHNVQDDYRVEVVDYPPGWNVNAQGADGSFEDDYFPVYGAIPNTNYGTLWYFSCESSAIQDAQVEFSLLRRGIIFFDEIDRASTRFSCIDQQSIPPQPTSYAVSIAKNGAPFGGTVGTSSDPNLCDINCEIETTYISSNDSITFTAIPASGMAFSGWGGDCDGTGTCTVAGNGNASISASFLEIDDPTQIPDEPVLTSASTLSTSEIELAWSSSQPNVDGFRIQRKDAPGGSWYRIKTLAGTAFSFTNTSLNPNHSYYYRVQAFNAAGESSYSNTQSATTESSAPHPPTNLSGWATSNRRVVLNWTDTNQSTASYRVERYSSQSGWSVVDYVGTGVTTSTVPVQAESTSSFRVRAYRYGDGLSSYSQSISVYACAAPSVPRLQSPYNGESDIAENPILEWDGDDEVNHWDLYFGNTPSPPLHTADIDNPDPGNDIEFQVSELVKGQKYYWRVVASASCNTQLKTPSASSVFETLGAPGEVTLLTPTDGAVGQPVGLVVDWNNVQTLGTALYELYLSQDADPAFWADTHTRTQLLVENLDPNSTYFWKVVARSADDPSLTTESSVWSFQTGKSSTTTLTLQATQDAGLRAGAYQNVNYGGDGSTAPEQTFLVLGRDDNIYQDVGLENVRGAVQFDLSSLPTDVEISNATLTMQFLMGTSNSQPLDMLIAPYTGSWSEGSITWANRPGTSAAHSVNGVFPISGFNPLQNDVTSVVQAWSDSALPNNGIEISIPEWENSGVQSKGFAQKENVAGGSELQVTYIEACPLPQAPSNPTPPDSTLDVVTPLILNWAGDDLASSYEVYLGTTPDPEHLELTTDTNLEIDNLAPSTTYHWRVEARSSCNSSELVSSPEWTFTTAACLNLPASNLLMPENDSTNLGREVLFDWSAVDGAGQYELLLGTSNPPTQVVYSGTESSVAIDVLPDQLYFWRIRSIPACHPSNESTSSVQQFTSAGRPQSDAGDSVLVEPGESIQVGGTPAASLGTPPYTYQWTVSPTTNASFSDDAVANPMFSATEPLVYHLSLVVTDSNGFRSSPSGATVVVNPDIFSDRFMGE